VIFATNLAVNLDPAFERRIRTHVLFELPGETERVQIWKAQLHPSRTPLADDVDFEILAHRHEVSGGDIQNAVLKAALAAAAEPIPDTAKKIHQRHFQTGIEQVLASKRVMQQSIFAEPEAVMPEPDITPEFSAQTSQLLTYSLSGAALLVALAALAVALLR
jgi:SpoVK/Ycf46/Vps4 family AAA+-type ATPase